MLKMVLLLMGFLLGINSFSFSARAENLTGNIVNISKEHNFVVIDLGAKDGIKPSQKFLVIRDGKKIAALEVLEVRAQASACDIERSYKILKLQDAVVSRDSYFPEQRMPVKRKVVEERRPKEKAGKLSRKNRVLRDEKKLLLESLSSSERERKRIEEENRRLKKKLREFKTSR